MKKLTKWCQKAHFQSFFCRHDEIFRLFSTKPPCIIENVTIMSDLSFSTKLLFKISQIEPLLIIITSHDHSLRELPTTQTVSRLYRITDRGELNINFS